MPPCRSHACSERVGSSQARAFRFTSGETIFNFTDSTGTHAALCVRIVR